MEALVGRKQEQEQLQEVLRSKEAQFVAVYGRRRVGKTFLIKHFFSGQLVLEFTGIHNGTLRQQLQGFGGMLTMATGADIPIATPVSWMEAFRYLQHFLAPHLVKATKKSLGLPPWEQNSRG